MATTTVAFHIESHLKEDGRRCGFFIMGPAAPGGGPVHDIKAYTVYPTDTEWDFSIPLPAIYDGLTIEKARLAVKGLEDALRDPDALSDEP